MTYEYQFHLMSSETVNKLTNELASWGWEPCMMLSDMVNTVKATRRDGTYEVHETMYGIMFRKEKR
jgi:hypothetical protein